MRLDVGILFNLNIQRWSLTRADLALTGDIEAAAGVSFGIAGANGNFDHTVDLIRGVNLGAVTFNVGPVPFRVAGQVDVEAFVKAEASASLSYDASVAVMANTRLGITFRNGRWNTIHDRGWHQQRRNPDVEATATAHAAVSIAPSITLIANWIGGPLISVAPHLAAQVGPGRRTRQCTAVLGWGVDVMVGARVDIQNPVSGNRLGCTGCSHLWRSSPVFSTELMPLFACEPCNQCRVAQG